MKILYKILHICSLILLFSSTTNAVTYQDIKTNYQNANSAVNGLLNFSSPKIGWALNSAFNNEYNNTKNKLITTYDNMTKYNNETINSQEIRTILEGAGTVNGLLRYAGPRANEHEDNYGRTFLSKARDELKKALDKFPVPPEKPKPVTPFNDGELVTIKSSDGLYLQMPTSPTTSTGVYQANFKPKSNRANQIFKLKKYTTNNYYIIGTKNGDYTGNNSGLLSTGGIYTSRFEINKVTPGAGNLFLLFSKGNNSFAFLNTKFKKFENKVSWALKDTNKSFKNLPTTAIFTIEKYTPQAAPETTNAVTYQDISTNYQDANSAVNGLLKFSTPKIGWALNPAFNNEYNNTKNKLVTTYDNMTKYNNETTNSQEIRTILEGAGTVNGLLKYAGPRANENEDNYGRTFLTKARDELKKALDKFPVPPTQLPVTPFNDGDKITIQNTVGTYYQMSSNNQGQFYYGGKIKSTNQILTVKLNPDNSYSFIGTVNGKTGMLQSNPNYARFILNKTTPDKKNKFYLYSKGDNSFVLSSDHKYQNPYSWKLRDTNESFENLPATAFLTIKKYTSQPQDGRHGQGESLVKLDPGYYKIKNVETSTYMTIKNQNLDPTVYGKQGKPWNIYSLRFENKNNNPEQIFKIEEENGWHKIIGSIDATYQSPNSGIVDTGFGTAYFNKNLSFNTFRKIKITQKTGINGYYITSEKDRNNKYGVDANKLIKDKSNNRFIFEKTTAPTIAAAEEEQKPITTGLKVEGINLDIKKVIGGLTQVSVGGNLICGINKNNQLFEWNNKSNSWKLLAPNYKHVSVGEDNIVLALGTNKKIYTRKDDKWVLFGKGIFPTIQVRKTQEDARKVADLPTPGTLPNPSSSSTSTTLPTPTQAPSIPIVGPGGVAYFASAQAIPMKQIEIGSREHLWGLGENNNKAYMWNGSKWIDKSMGMKFNYISVGVDGTVKALDSTNKLASWTGSNWSISPFKLHQISVTNKDKHWAITKEDDGSFNVYKFVNNGYILRAKNLQQVSTNLDGTLFGISTLKTGGGFEIYARIIKLYGKILDKLNNAKSKTTVKEKIAEINKAINLSVAEKVTTELTTDELNALKLETYTEIFNILTKQLEKAKEENVLKELKDLVTTAGASVLIEDKIKPLLISYAETNIKLEEKTKKEETKKTTTTTAQSIRRRRRNIATTTNSRGRGGAVYQPGSGRRGRDVIPVNSVF